MNYKDKKTANKNKYDKKFFENVVPVKLTEARRVKLHTESWGLLSEYYLESVKVDWLKTGVLCSSATLKVSDRSGQIVCLIKGPSVGLLFGLSPEKWTEVENLCASRQQLFYRYFKDGLSINFGFEQKLFYNFCLTNQRSNVFIVVFKRCVNMRNRDKSDAFLEILDLRECEHSILDLYISYIRKNVELLDDTRKSQPKI